MNNYSGQPFLVSSSNSYTLDLEANGLDDADTIHCIVIREPDGKKREFINVVHNLNEKSSFVSYLRMVSRLGILVGHNILNYDLPLLVRTVPALAKIVDRLTVVDTLVVSRLINFKRHGGHSLESYAEEFGLVKAGLDITDWSTFQPIMLERCRSDVDINYLVFEKYLRFLTDPSWGDSLRSEHFVAQFCQELHWAGFAFDDTKAHQMHERLSLAVSDHLNDILAAFPPKWVLWRRVEPKRTKSGALGLAQFKWLMRDEEYEIDCGDGRVRIRGNSDGTLDLSPFDGRPFDVYRLQEFNPGSPRQIVERLNEYGWKPTERTKGHEAAVSSRTVTEDHEKFGWKVSEKNLSTLPDDAPPAAFKLAQFLTLQSRVSDLEEWLAEVREDGRVHGSFLPIGAWTERVAHHRPNTANIPQSKPSKLDTPFQASIQQLNGEMRELWIAGKGKRLVGTDADGVQMRIFAHLCQDENLINALVNGKKENETDIHSLNRRLLGSVCGSRDVAKTFIYAFLLGAGTGQVSSILSCSKRDAKNAVLSFIEALPGLKELKQSRIPREAGQGYFTGLDGRKVICDSEHLMLSGHLQCGEKVIMSRWIEKWMDELDRSMIEYTPVNWVHDEVQTEVEDDDDVVAFVKEVQLRSMVEVGEELGMICPLKATSVDGYNWHETH